MTENYIWVNGKKIILTDDMLKHISPYLAPQIAPQINPFGHDENGFYYLITTSGAIDAYSWDADSSDRCFAGNLNCFKTKEFAKQISLSQLLYRKLLKFGYDNNCIAPDIWESPIQHWCIYYDFKNNDFRVESLEDCKYRDVYFSTKERAQQAIEEVVMPFMSEHPEFEW